MTTMSEFEIKDSGARHNFDSGMMRDTEDNKTDYTSLVHGPMMERWAEHATKGRAKYPDVALGVPNWTQADGPAELQRFKRSAFRHMLQWLRGETDEDHAAAVMFNIDGAEFVAARMAAEYTPGGLTSEPARAPATFGGVSVSSFPAGYMRPEATRPVGYEPDPDFCDCGDTWAHDGGWKRDNGYADEASDYKIGGSE